MAKEIFKGNWAIAINRVFVGFLIIYLVLLLLDQMFDGGVNYYLNLNQVLIFVIILGILDVFSEHYKVNDKYGLKGFSLTRVLNEGKEQVSKRDYYLVYGLGVLGFAIIKWKTFKLGWLSWAIAIIAGILIVLLSILILEEDEDEEGLENEYEEESS